MYRLIEGLTPILDALFIAGVLSVLIGIIFILCKQYLRAAITEILGLALLAYTYKYDVEIISAIYG